MAERLTDRVERLEAKVAALEAASPTNLAELVAAEVRRIVEARTWRDHVQEMRATIDSIEAAIEAAEG